MVDKRLKEFDEPEPAMPALDLATVRVAYDSQGDLLMLKFVAARPALTMDGPDDLALRVDPSSGEIFGVEIEGFKGFYLKTRPKLAAEWSAAGVEKPEDWPESRRVAFVRQILGRAHLIDSQVSSGTHQ
jgi:hypothetical protein